MKINKSNSILEVKGLKKYYSQSQFLFRKKWIKALDDVSFNVYPGKTLGIVGESGCGKSTLAKSLIQLESPTAGEIFIEGNNLEKMSKKQVCHNIQMVFQDPYNSINPRRKIFDIIAEPLVINENYSKKELNQKVDFVLNSVGLDAKYAQVFPHTLSGGQRQRVGLARALIMKPKILVLDEPLSALDVSVSAQVLNLLLDLQDEFKLTYILISHDINLVRSVADDILVMYLGKVVEKGDAFSVLDNPLHPYTYGLKISTPQIDEEFSSAPPIEGEMPSPINPPCGCTFHPRCPKVMDICKVSTPQLNQKSGSEKLTTYVSCHLYE